MEDNPPKADTVHILNLSGFTKLDRFEDKYLIILQRRTRSISYIIYQEV
jgi:hypothetical protein